MLNLLILEQFPIFEQLKLEEALLRADTGNWCLINSGSPPAIVMGISSKLDLHVDPIRFQQNPLPLIRRYSGGGTVLVEETTLFVSWIFNHDALSISPYPKDVMRWTEPLLQSLLSPLPICLQENDYVVGNKKCGGNAQYFVKGRFAHHSSFLWDYTQQRMEYLLHPPKMPHYRKQRNHTDFLYTLKGDFPSFLALKEQLSHGIQRLYSCRTVPLLEVQELQKRPHRTSTRLENWS